MALSSDIQQTLFILNLSSGCKKSTPLLRELTKRGLNYFVSESVIDFKKFIRSESGNFRTFVICGGDGTINSVINETHSLEVSYAIYPGGSGNGLSRELGYKKNLDHLLQSIERNEEQTIDLLKINKNYFINMAGIGFDGYVAHQFDKSKKRGFRSYISETLKSLKKYHPIEANIITDSTTINGSYFMINIANTRQFGNNAFITPNAQYNDGLIEVALIKKIPFLHLPVFILKLFNLGLTNSKYLEYIQTKTVTVDTNAEFYHIDGEPLKYNAPLKVSIPKQLKFIKPI